jgi:L-Ala-D/L-Glu epimerase
MRNKLTVERRSWNLREPFVISRNTYTASNVILVKIASGGCVGRGEATGVDYHGENQASMEKQIDGVRPKVEAGATRSDLLELMPAGGARNALDAALWDLEAKRTGIPAWQLAGLSSAPEVSTAMTIGIRPIDEYEERARSLANYEWLKIKVSADRPLDAIRAVRRGAPNARLIVDANQSWDVATVYELGRALAELGVALLEQPVRVDRDEELLAGRSVIPVCADEAIDALEDLPRLRGRYDVINIKLDKTGGLTAALALVSAARAEKFGLMVGCMVAGSLAMAPGMILAQLCDFVDLDGPLLQADDSPFGIVYDEKGTMRWPARELWG